MCYQPRMQQAIQPYWIVTQSSLQTLLQQVGFSLSNKVRGSSNCVCCLLTTLHVYSSHSISTEAIADNARVDGEGSKEEWEVEDENEDGLEAENYHLIGKLADTLDSIDLEKL